MDVAEIVARLEPWRARHRRPAWRPRVIDGESGSAGSKFGGIPWLAAGEDWPVCGACGRPLPFFFQLDLAEVPPALAGRFGSGLLQLFYCTECDGGWEPFAESHMVRVVHLEGLSAPPHMAPEVQRFPAKTIVGWEELIDLPDPEEHDELGLRYTYDFQADIVRLECPEVGLTVERDLGEELAEAVAEAAVGDKLSGWPAWVQGVEYPSCPRCEQRMGLVFQLDSDDNLPYMWGDVGIGHLTQCPEHREVVTFAWACS